VRGLSRLEPLRATLLNEDAARRATTSFWNRGARPGTALTHPGQLSAPAQARLKAQYDSIAAGADNTGATVVLEEGMQPAKLSLTAEEAQYIETRKLNREEVCAAYDVPPPVVHILDRATFSNITEQMRSMYRDTMAPRLGLYESVLDTQLRPDFDPQGGLYAEFLMDEVLRGDFEQRAAAYEIMTRIGGMTPAEVRKDGEPAAPGAGHGPAVCERGDDPAGRDPGAGAAPGGVADRARSGPVAAVGAAGRREAPAPAKCVSCDTEAKTSARGLCRSCEGKRGRPGDPQTANRKDS
jgi:phage portal protein BeeE